jgi:hypothetical protein
VTLFLDSDERWLAGANDSGGTTYVNKEQFEELVTWLQVPVLLEIAEDAEGAAASRKELEQQVTETLRAIGKAHYSLDRYLHPERASVEPEQAMVPDMS